MRSVGFRTRALRLLAGCAGFLLAVICFAGSSLAQTVALSGTRPPQAMKLSSRVAADRALTVHVSFKLRNPEELERLLADLQDPDSPQYHRWLTPEQFNARFGRTPQEVKAVSQWLAGQGLRVMRSSNRGIGATATAAHAEKAFAVALVGLADGASYSNASEPRIRSQFADIIGSIDGLDNLRHSAPVTTRTRQLGSSRLAAARRSGGLPGRIGPAANAMVGKMSAGSSPASDDTGFGPQDLWTFYDETPPLNGGIDGSGSDCIGIIQDSDYSDASITMFNALFSLPSASVTRVFADVSSPGINSDETEALVDVEWAHSAAPGTPINVYIGNSQFENIDPLTDALTKAVSDNSCGTISFTYSFCGAAPSFYSSTLGNVLAQAASQGQSVFAASGDWGSAGLVASGDACVPATDQNVSEFSANPNVTAIGGTQFVPNFDSQGNDVGSVSESAWSNGAGATGGGKSAIFSKPLYQRPVTPADGARDVPDVALGASNLTPGFFWVDESDGQPIASCCIGGTSVSTPVWAGVSKLIAETGGGGRLGNMNPTYLHPGRLERRITLWSARCPNRKQWLQRRSGIQCISRL